MSILRAALAVGAAVAFLIAGVGLAARYVPITNHITMAAAAASPYLMLGAPAAVIVALLLKRRICALLASGLTVVSIAVQLPLYLGSAHHDTEAAATVRVMTANLKLGGADADALVSSARADADILAIQELTFDAVDRLSSAGLDEAFPYRFVHPHDIASGAGLWSRYPIHSATPVGKFELAFLRARIQVTGVAVDPTVVVAHLSGPWPQPIDQWEEDMGFLPPTMTELAQRAGTGAVIVAGDFNGTTGMRPFRELLRDGYHDAAEQAGAGMTRTYPADSRMPPLLGIDHILIRNCTASSARTAPLPGSDHRAVIATVHLP